MQLAEMKESLKSTRAAITELKAQRKYADELAATAKALEAAQAELAELTAEPAPSLESLLAEAQADTSVESEEPAIVG